MIKPPRVWEENPNLMITETDDETKALRKVGTNEVYDAAIDLIEGFNDGVPFCRFTYEEINSPFARESEDENGVV